MVHHWGIVTGKSFPNGGVFGIFCKGVELISLESASSPVSEAEKGEVGTGSQTSLRETLNTEGRIGSMLRTRKKDKHSRNHILTVTLKQVPPDPG